MQNAMLTRILVVVLFVAGSLIPIGPAQADENHGYGKGKSPHGGMMEEHHMSGNGEMMGHHRSVSPLAMKEELGLSNEQAKTLEPLESDYRKASIKNRADLKVAMIDLSTLLDQKTPDKNAISKKVDEIGAIQKSMMLYRVDTMLKLKEILTPAQYEKYRGEIKEHMEHRTWGDKHEMGEMMHHGYKGERGYSHGKSDD